MCAKNRQESEHEDPLIFARDVRRQRENSGLHSSDPSNPALLIIPSDSNPIRGTRMGFFIFFRLTIFGERKYPELVEGLPNTILYIYERTAA